MYTNYSLDLVLIMMIFFFLAIICIMLVLTLYFIGRDKKDNVTYINQPKTNSLQGASTDTIRKEYITDKQKELTLKNYQKAGFHFTDLTLEFFNLKDYETTKEFQKDIEKAINKNTKL